MGLHNQGFDRLIKKMDEIAGTIDEDVIMQIGHTNYTPKNATYFRFKDDFSEIVNLNKNARLVVCHGGAGSIIAALEQKTPVIAVPRLKKFREHLNDHQLEIVQVLNAENKINVVYDINQLESVINSVGMGVVIQSNKQQLLDSLKTYLSNLKLEKERVKFE